MSATCHQMSRPPPSSDKKSRRFKICFENDIHTRKVINARSLKDLLKKGEKEDHNLSNISLLAFLLSQDLLLSWLRKLQNILFKASRSFSARINWIKNSGFFYSMTTLKLTMKNISKLFPKEHFLYWQNIRRQNLEAGKDGFMLVTPNKTYSIIPTAHNLTVKLD